MTNTSTLMIAGANSDDEHLTALIRSSLMGLQERDRMNWLKQIELGLDGYGERHRETAARIGNIVRQLVDEHQTDARTSQAAATGFVS